MRSARYVRGLERLGGFPKVALVTTIIYHVRDCLRGAGGTGFTALDISWELESVRSVRYRGEVLRESVIIYSLIFLLGPEEPVP